MLFCIYMLVSILVLHIGFKILCLAIQEEIKSFKKI